MELSQVVRFMQSCTLAVQSSVSPTGSPQSAVVGIVVTNDAQIFFDTLEQTRKVENLRRNPRIAFVIGGTVDGDERTVQYEGIADEPRGSVLESLKDLYFRRFPDGRQRSTWPGLIYIRAVPTWIRFSDFNRSPSEILEFKAAEFRDLEAR
jgi:general stress protein 26